MARSKLSAKRFWELRKEVKKACIIHRGNGKGMEPVLRDTTKRIIKVLGKTEMAAFLSFVDTPVGPLPAWVSPEWIRAQFERPGDKFLK